MDNTAPSVKLAPHPDQILWFNINSTKVTKIILELVFWFLVIVIFMLFFVPQVLLISLFS